MHGAQCAFPSLFGYCHQIFTAPCFKERKKQAYLFTHLKVRTVIWWLLFNMTVIKPLTNSVTSDYDEMGNTTHQQLCSVCAGLS